MLKKLAKIDRREGTDRLDYGRAQIVVTKRCFLFDVVVDNSQLILKSEVRNVYIWYMF